MGTAHTRRSTPVGGAGTRGAGAGGWARAAKRGLFAGPREAEGIAEWLRRRAGPSATRLEDEDGAQALIDGRDVVVIGFFQVSWWYWGPGHGSRARGAS